MHNPIKNNKKGWLGARYDSGSYFQRNIALTLLENTEFDINDTVLDIGCGPGWITQHVAELNKACSIIGLDKSESMIDYARENYTQPNIEYVSSNIMEYTPVQKFNRIFSFCCLHWVEDHSALLEKIYGFLESNGSILFALPTNYKDVIHHIIEEVGNSEKWAQYTDGSFKLNIFSFTDSEYTQLLKTNGFQNIKVDTRKILMPFNNINILRQFISALPLFDHCLEPVDINDFANDVAALFIEKNDCINNKYVFESSIQVVEALKGTQL